MLEPGELLALGTPTSQRLRWNSRSSLRAWALANATCRDCYNASSEGAFVLAGAKAGESGNFRLQVPVLRGG